MLNLLHSRSGTKPQLVNFNPGRLVRGQLVFSVHNIIDQDMRGTADFFLSRVR